MRILGISGSLRRDSYNTKLLREAGRLLPPGAELVEFDGLKAVAPYDADDEASPVPPRGVFELRAAIAEADAILIATPEYNHSIPGVLKNAIDWASRPTADAALKNKPVAVIGTSTGMFGAVWAQAETRKALAGAGARVIDRELPVGSADEQFHPLDGRLVDEDLRIELGGIVARARLRSAARPAAGDLRGQHLDPVAPRVAGEEAAAAGDAIVPADVRAGRRQRLGQRVELRVGAGAQAGMGLGRGREVLGHADVQLLRAGREPDAAARSQLLGLLELAQPEQAAVEAARLALAAGRRGDLHVVEAVDHPNTPSGS